MDYQKAYALLVGTVSDAIDELHKPCEYEIPSEVTHAINILEEGLETTEEMYISSSVNTKLYRISPCRTAELK